MQYQSFSSNETRKLGGAFVKQLLRQKKKNKAVIVGLRGDLGSGKTTFVQGCMRGFGIRKKTTSPTFILMRRFSIKNNSPASVFHIDAYRVRRPIEFIRLGLLEIMNNPRFFVFIEWAEKIKRFLPKETLWVRFRHGRREGSRTITFPFHLHERA